MTVLAIYSPRSVRAVFDSESSLSINNPWATSLVPDTPVWIHCTTHVISGDASLEFGIAEVQWLDGGGVLRRTVYRNAAIGSLLPRTFVGRFMGAIFLARARGLGTVTGTATLFRWG